MFSIKIITMFMGSVLFICIIIISSYHMNICYKQLSTSYIFQQVNIYSLKLQLYYLYTKIISNTNLNIIIT